MLDKFKKGIITLIGYCKAVGRWEVNHDDPPYHALLPIAAKYYGEIWSYEQFDSLLQYHLSQMKTATIGPNTIKQIIDHVEVELTKNMQDIFFVVPLKGAWIDSTVVIGDLAIIKTASGSAWTSSPVSLLDIVADVASITGFSKEKISQAFKKITHSRAKDFLSCPLLIIKRYGQYDVITERRTFFLKYTSLFIRILANHNKVEQGNKYLGWIHADQFFSIDQHNNYHHYPLRDPIALGYDLSFLTKTDNQDVLKKIMAIFDSKGSNDLQSLYFRAMKFYNFGLHASESSVDAVSQRLLNTLISAEALLSFSTRGEKKSKLASVMVGLLCIPSNKREEYYKAVIESYIDRSSLVHAGKQDLGKYIIDLETEKKESESLTILGGLMSSILVKFPDWYTEVTKGITADKYLLAWQQKVKSFIPVVKYNVFQKIVSKTIVLLQRVARLKGDN